MNEIILTYLIIISCLILVYFFRWFAISIYLLIYLIFDPKNGALLSLIAILWYILITIPYRERKEDN
jgi:hypothetical protein